jgi:TRAP-type C4-dicarboxylate transport system permease small subunit
MRLGMNESASDNLLTVPVAGWLGRLIRVTEALCAVLLIAMTAIITWQIIGRYVLNDTPKWSEQLAGVLMVYLTLLGGALAVHDHRHIALDYFYQHFSSRWQFRCRLLMLALMLAFSAIMLVYGVRMALLVQQWTIPTLNISQAVNYWSFPVAGLLMLVFFGLQLRALLRARQAGQRENEAGEQRL